MRSPATLPERSLTPANARSVVGSLRRPSGPRRRPTGRICETTRAPGCRSRHPSEGTRPLLSDLDRKPAKVALGLPSNIPADGSAPPTDWGAVSCCRLDLCPRFREMRVSQPGGAAPTKVACKVANAPSCAESSAHAWQCRSRAAGSESRSRFRGGCRGYRRDHHCRRSCSRSAYCAQGSGPWPVLRRKALPSATFSMNRKEQACSPGLHQR
jgi:hypothetical protein